MKPLKSIIFDFYLKLSTLKAGLVCSSEELPTKRQIHLTVLRDGRTQSQQLDKRECWKHKPVD